MEEIKIINRQIRRVAIELIFALIIFILAFSIWNNPNKTLALMASSNENQSVIMEEIKPLKLENIYPIDDNEAINNYEKGEFKISNKSNVNSKYSIIYRIYNSSTLDHNFLKYQFIIDNYSKVDFLSNLSTNTSQNYTEFVLYNGELEANSSKTFNFIMWIDNKVGNEAQNKVLSSDFIVKSYGTEISFK